MFVDCVVGEEDAPVGAGLGAMIDVGLSVADAVMALVVVGASVSDSISTTVVGARAADGGEPPTQSLTNIPTALCEDCPHAEPHNETTVWIFPRVVQAYR